MLNAISLIVFREALNEHMCIFSLIALPFWRELYEENSDIAIIELLNRMLNREH